jgi:CMP-N-acetylneuraminic acid synthetase
MKNRETGVLLGVIPARSGSKGIKNKNLRKVCGRPLIYYTIREALRYKGLYKAIVSTDSALITKISRGYGIEVPFLRPKRLAQDNTPMLAVLRHALLESEKIYRVKLSGVLLLDPTSPIRKKEDIARMMDIFFKSKPDLVVAVAKSRRNPYFNMLKIDRSGYARTALKGEFIRRQDIPLTLDITNNCWIFSRKAILRNWRIPERTIACEINGGYIDIDSKEDLKFFGCFLKMGKIK